MDSGSTQVTDLAAMIEKCEVVDVRLALIRADTRWQIRYGEVVLGYERATHERTWCYPTEAFVQRRLPGLVMAGLLRGEPQPIADMQVAAPPTQSSCNYERLASQVRWNHAVLPWPRTEWTISWPQTPSTRPRLVMVGDGPTFLDSQAAFCAFFHESAPDHNLDQAHRLWRVVQLDRRAWIHRVTIGPDALTVAVKGAHRNGVQAELTTPNSSVVRRVGRTGQVRLGMPHGLAPATLLMLRNEDDWLDFRYFPWATPGRDGDQSVVWDLPGTQIGVLVAGGESPYVEFKREVPGGESRKNMLKTVAAFASGEGGTIIVGVEDNTRVVGVDPTTLDPQMLALQRMIRDSIVPEPPFTVRAAEFDGKTVLLVEVNGGRRWYAYNPAKPEFYLRRGASTVPARMDEIGIGFGRP